MEFLSDFRGRGDIWWESTSVLKIVRFQRSLVQILMFCVVAFCMGIAICHRPKYGQVWGPQLPYQKLQENCAA